MPLLTNDDWSRRLCKAIDVAGKKCQVELVGFVVMPEHIHVLIYPMWDSVSGNIPEYLSQLKEPFSKEIKRLLSDAKSPLLTKLTVRERPDKRTGSLPLTPRNHLTKPYDMAARTFHRLQLPPRLPLVRRGMDDLSAPRTG